MTRAVSARAAILGSIRERLAASPRVTAHLPVVAAGEMAAATAMQDSRTLLQQFQQRLDGLGAHCWPVRDEIEAAAVFGSITGAARAAAIVRSDAPVLGAVAPSAVDLRDVTRADLLACDVGVTTAQWGIVETGTLVLESASEKSRLLSLLPRVHVALLDASHLCVTIGEALGQIRAKDDAGVMSNRAITFITGPSRTSDIELTLVIGVHGPQELHVIVMTHSQEA